ncbi:Mitochondrial substrate carrier family protein Q [Diplonema papillatum]|nr:Mitochondrial substrate carrier family protein Q [Diplonema papillatum]|eukprot:gene11904-18360_t
MSVPAATPAMQAVAGALGGCAALAITYPLQMVTMRLQMHEKMRQQQQKAAEDVSGRQSPSLTHTDSRESLGHVDSIEENEATTPKGRVSSKDRPSSAPQAPHLSSMTPGNGLSNAPAAVVREAERTNIPLNHLSEEMKSRTAIALVRTLLKQPGGWKRLYSGLNSALIGQCFIQAIYYYLYSLAQTWSQKLRGKSRVSWLDSTLCATFAGAGGATLTNPIWVISTRQIKTGEKTTTQQALKDLFREEGLAGLFKGLGPALLLVANPTIQYGTFEKLKSLYLRYRSVSSLSDFDMFFLGALAKLLATVVTYPYIMAKTTLQSQSARESEDEQFNSTFQCLAGVYETEGFSGLYRGLNSKLWQSILTAALLFVLHARCLALVQRICMKR